jgi:hypothetical protein
MSTRPSAKCGSDARRPRDLFGVDPLPLTPRLWTRRRRKGVSVAKGKRFPAEFRQETDPKAPPAPDLVERRFVAEVPDQLWLADLTYVPTLEGYLFLAVVIDMCSRKIVGWSMRDDLKAALVVDALARSPSVGRSGSRGWSLPWAHTGTPTTTPPARAASRPQGRMDQPSPLPKPRPGAPIDLPLHRNILQPTPPPLLARRRQPRRGRATLPKQTRGRKDGARSPAGMGIRTSRRLPARDL